jgi:signal transduction histidine kinase
MVYPPLEDATQRARILQARIAAVLLGLGLIAALLGMLLALRITRGLDAIARSADAIRAGAAREIVVPRGRNEAARLGRTLDELLTSLQRERSALQELNAELDQRVAARTREVERLAEQERYAAVVRERLKIARDLHDTLAHSMMAMLTEVRLLKRLANADPGALAEELTRAEEAAHQGLKEARAAIAQMRFNPVRDSGLAAALDDLVRMFSERSGIPVDFTTDVQPGAYADERAESLFRIAEEALHNVERHANATRVTISLREPAGGNGLTMTISDDGIGFDPEATRPGHYGLAGLREQALLIGASLAIQSAPQMGTTIRVALPLAPGSDA